jgi:hypothetical protein
MTTRIANGDEEFLPTFVDPAAREIRALDGVPKDVDTAAAVRGWAADQGADHYFIAYSVNDQIVAEEFEAGSLVSSRAIETN